jgi:hypothetical protein
MHLLQQQFSQKVAFTGLYTDPWYHCLWMLKGDVFRGTAVPAGAGAEAPSLSLFLELSEQTHQVENVSARKNNEPVDCFSLLAVFKFRGVVIVKCGS